MSRKAQTAGGFNPTSSRAGGAAFSSSASSLAYVFTPPDFSTISDASVVVSLKNLLKKDATTKTKALEELVAYAKRHPYDEGGPEEGVLDAWVQLYPRTSIDNARRVRELAHVVQFELMRSARKRMDKRLPSIVGAWLAGGFDRDRAVARNAAAGLSAFMDTDEKVTLFWRRCQPQVLEFSTEAINETPDTLSDPRSTSADDADAKYYRVIGASLSLVIHLIERADPATLPQGLDAFLAQESVWKMATAADAFVRRAVYKLLQVCLGICPALVEPQLHEISTYLTSKALKSDQSSSAMDLVKTLTMLTKRYPQAWISKKKEKQPLERLKPLVEKGSQGSSHSFWIELDGLLQVIPQQNLSHETAAGFLKSLRCGISGRMELDRYSLPAWTCYINAWERFIITLTPNVEFVRDTFYPLTQRHLFPVQERPSWFCRELSLIAKGWRIVASNADETLLQSVDAEWESLASSLLTRMANSLPEVSEDFEKSQEATAEEGRRWFKLAQEILAFTKEENKPNESERRLEFDVVMASNSILVGALDLLQRRNYKPFGAASVIASAFTECPALFEDASNTVVKSLLTMDFRPVLQSRSAPQFLSCVNAMGNIPEQATHYRTLWTTLVNTELSEAQVSLPTIMTLLSNPVATPLAREHAALQDFLAVTCLDCAQGTNDHWALFGVTLSHDVLVEEKLKSLIAGIIHLVATGNNASAVLMALNALLKSKPNFVLDDHELMMELITGLLMLSEGSGADAAIATTAKTLFDIVDGRFGKELLLTNEIIRSNLEDVTLQSLEISTLVTQATHATANGTALVELLFPSSDVWREQLEPFLQVTPDPSLSLTSSIGGAYFLVKGKTDSVPDCKQDRLGRAIPARMGIYTVQLLSQDLEMAKFSSLPLQRQAELVYLLFLTMELASDQLALLRREGLWTLSEEGKTDLANFLDSCQKILVALMDTAPGWKDGTMGEDGLIGKLMAITTEEARDFSPASLYSAKALSHVLGSLVDKHGFPADMEARFAALGITRATPETLFLALAFISGFRDEEGYSKLVESPTLYKLCRRQVSDIAGAFPSLGKTLQSMVLLNACISAYKEGEVPVDGRSMTMAVQQITSWTDTPDETGPELAAEVCKGLRRLFPNVKKVYGPYWTQAVNYCLQLWGRTAGPADAATISKRLPYLHASLKLMAELEDMRQENDYLPQEEQNDDLVEAVDEGRKRADEALVELLKAPISLDTEPSRLVDGVLLRRVYKINERNNVGDPSELFGIINSESRDIQTAAFDLLDRVLPIAQEEWVVNVLLENKKARLPAELLSLLLDAPTFDDYPDDQLSHFPPEVRGYLLAWLLIFDLFKHAPHRIREDYAETMKTEDYVSPLLGFTFDVMGHSAGHPLNPDSLGLDARRIRAYEVRIDAEDQVEQDMYHLLVHLFYLLLRYLPGLFRDWHRDCRSKQTKNAVEDWMAKHFSPLVISDALDAVADWDADQAAAAAGGASGDDEGVALRVRVNRAAREVTASYEIDEDRGSIVIRIKEGFPLQGVAVEGINRVAVNERRWRAWLMSTEGAITFANGAIIDGLVAFRRNVNGALKGQTECAICYSIVSSDKKLPDKACPTCHNLFHRLCLYQWFQTSNANTCPLCRNPISFIGSDSRRGRNAG